jgi:hypothetical protein
MLRGLKHREVWIEPGHCVLVPASVSEADEHAWARGYVQAWNDYRQNEWSLPRSVDDLPSSRLDGLLTDQRPRCATGAP